MIEIRRGRIDVGAVLESVRRDDAGAIVLFVGAVRADGDLRALDYEAYRPMALKTFAGVVERATEKFGVRAMSIVHREGRVPVGGDSVAIACAAPHRAEAFAACTWAMDEIKRAVPIWKTESASDAARPRTGRRAPRRRTRKSKA